jgi:Fe-S cluster assembly protein SufD
LSHDASLRVVSTLPFPPALPQAKAPLSLIRMIPSVAQCKTEFEQARRRRRSEPMQFSDIRWEALDRFLSLGFPTTHDEEWRFTSVAALAEEIFTLAAEPAAGGAQHAGLAPLRLPDLFGTELVFVNGYYVPGASTPGSLPPGACAEPLAAVLDSSPGDVASHLTRVASFERHAFVALNTALFADGACIVVPAHTVVDKPIHVQFISTGEADMRPAMSHPRVLVVLDDGSRATIVESYGGPAAVKYLTNAVTEIVLGEDAVLDHYKLQHESTEAYHISTTQVVAARNANWSTHSISLGGSLVRHEVAVVLGGENGNCTLNGLYLADRRRLVDHHTTIDHVMGQARSRNNFKAILADQATGVFDGTIVVGPDAQKAHIRQTSRALLLSGDARIHSTAHAEMLAPEITSTQRAGARQLDENAASYMRSRGVGHAEARRLAILAFARDVLNRMPLQPLRSQFEELLQPYLDRMLGSVT